MNSKRISTKYTFLIGILIIFFSPFKLLSRNTQVFNLTDSVTILLNNTIFENNPPQISKIIYINDKLIFTEFDKKSVFILDLKTNSIKSFNPGFLQNKTVSIDNFDVTPNEIFVATASHSMIFKINYSGELISTLSLFRPISKKLDLGCFGYSLPLRRFYFLDNELIKESEIKKHPRKALKFYNKKLIYEIKEDGSFSNYLGFFDSLYFNHKLLYSYKSSFATNQKEILLFSQNLSHSIYILNLSNHAIKQLYFPGKYLTVKDADLPINSKPYPNNEAYYKDLISSFFYFDLKSLNNSNLCFRSYCDGTLDNTENLSGQENNERMKKKNCSKPSERLTAQRELLMNKKKYVQIIDFVNNQLIFDGAFPFLGTFFLNSRIEINNSFFTFQWNRNSIVVYRYIVNEE